MVYLDKEFNKLFSKRLDSKLDFYIYCNDTPKAFEDLRKIYEVLYKPPKDSDFNKLFHL